MHSQDKLRDHLNHPSAVDVYATHPELRQWLWTTNSGTLLKYAQYMDKIMEGRNDVQKVLTVGHSLMNALHFTPVQPAMQHVRSAYYLRKFTRGLDPEMPTDPTVLVTDNKAARDLSYNPEHHGCSKHIERRHFFIRDMVEALEIVVPLVNTKDNDADFFTKPLMPKRFKALRRRVMNFSDADAPCEQRPRGGVGMRGG